MEQQFQEKEILKLGLKHLFSKICLTTGIVSIAPFLASTSVMATDATAISPETNVEQEETEPVQESVKEEAQKEEEIQLKFSLYDSNMNPVRLPENLSIYPVSSIENGVVKEGATPVSLERYDTYGIFSVSLKSEMTSSLGKTVIQVRSNPKTVKPSGSSYTFPLDLYQDDILYQETRMEDNLSVSTEEVPFLFDNYTLLTDTELSGYIMKWDLITENKEISTVLSDGSLKVTKMESYSKDGIDLVSLVAKYGDTRAEESLDYFSSVPMMQDYSNLKWNETHFEVAPSVNQEIYSMFGGEVIESNAENNFVTVRSKDKVVIYYGLIPACTSGEISAGTILGYGYPGKTLEIYSVQSGAVDVYFEHVMDRWGEDSRYEYSNDEIRMPLYLQGSSEWGGNTYGTSTIGTAGCGPSAMAMVLSDLKHETITPARLVEEMPSMGSGMWYYCPGAGSYHSIFPVIAENYGVNCQQFGVSYENIVSELEQGHSVIVSLGSGPIYHGDGHFIVIRDVSENGNFYINDSAGIFDLNTEYTWEDLGGHIGSVETARSIY